MRGAFKWFNVRKSQIKAKNAHSFQFNNSLFHMRWEGKDIFLALLIQYTVVRGLCESHLWSDTVYISRGCKKNPTLGTETDHQPMVSFLNTTWLVHFMSCSLHIASSHRTSTLKWVLFWSCHKTSPHAAFQIFLVQVSDHDVLKKRHSWVSQMLGVVWCGILQDWLTHFFGLM